MYDMSLSYMMYLPVSHYTADHHSAFCVLQNTSAGFAQLNYDFIHQDYVLYLQKSKRICLISHAATTT